MYTFSIQDIVKHLQHNLESRSASGLVICDNRTNSLNSNVAHSVFTRMFQQSGNPYPNLAEMPVFGDSRNHPVCNWPTL